MRLGIRLLFAFFLINGIAAFFVLRVFHGGRDQARVRAR